MTDGITVISGKPPTKEEVQNAALNKSRQERTLRVLEFVGGANRNAGLNDEIFLFGSDFDLGVESRSYEEASHWTSGSESLRVDIYPLKDGRTVSASALFIAEILIGKYGPRPFDRPDPYTISDGESFHRRAQEIVTHLEELGFLATEFFEPIRSRRIPQLDESEDFEAEERGIYTVYVCALLSQALDRSEYCHNGMQEKLEGLVDFGEGTLTDCSSTGMDSLPVTVLTRLIGERAPKDLTSFPSLTFGEIERLAESWDIVGRDIDLFRDLEGRKPDKIRFCVDGLLPCGLLALLAGAQEVGKSTLSQELAIAVAGGDYGTWLGQPVKLKEGLVVYLAGEDNDATFSERNIFLDPEAKTKGSVLARCADCSPLPVILERLRKIPAISLIVVDPARKYIDGDEDSSDNVNRFLTALEHIASEKNCPVLVIAHLTKNAKPQNLQAVRSAIRGSGVFADRPRVIIGMFRQGDKTIAGVCKNNMPPSCDMMTEAKTFYRDKATLRLIPGNDNASSMVTTKEQAKNNGDKVENSLKKKVLTAIETLISEGKRLCRTGKYELYKYHLEELKGISRAKLRGIVAELIDEGRLEVSGDQISLVQ